MQSRKSGIRRLVSNAKFRWNSARIGYLRREQTLLNKQRFFKEYSHNIYLLNRVSLLKGRQLSKFNIGLSISSKEYQSDLNLALSFQSLKRATSLKLLFNCLGNYQSKAAQQLPRTVNSSR